MTFNRAGDVNADALHILFLLYGDPGAGKTHAACQAPRPLVVLTERNGMTTIRRSNPDALVVEVTDVSQLREIVIMATKGELPDGRRSLVIDSLTEVQRLFRDEIMASKGGASPTFSLQDWGVLAEKMRRLMRSLRDVPYHVVATCLAEAKQNDDGVRFVRPQFEGQKTSSEIAQYFNGVAFLYKKASRGEDGDQGVQHLAMFDGPSRYTTKPCHPIAGLIEPDVAGWFAQLGSNTADEA